MTRSKVALFAGLMGAALSGGAANAFSAPASPLYGAVNETRFLVGLHWNFGDVRPELVLGVRRTETTSDEQVFGGKLDVAIPLTTDIAALKPVVRLMGVVGNRDVQGEAGGGIRLLDWQPLIAADIQAPYSTAGANYFFTDGLKPYIGIDSLARPRAPKSVIGRPPT